MFLTHKGYSSSDESWLIQVILWKVHEAAEDVLKCFIYVMEAGQF